METNRERGETPHTSGGMERMKGEQVEDRQKVSAHRENKAYQRRS
jgi:hypothetical protein